MGTYLTPSAWAPHSRGVHCRPRVLPSAARPAARRPAASTPALLLLLLAATAAPAPVRGARLAFVPLSSESHVAAFAALSTEVEALSGHEVHLVG
jgi:hypothetical protein